MTPLGTGEQVTSCPLQHFLCISHCQEEILVTHYQNTTFHTFIPEETKRIRPMSCLSLHCHQELCVSRTSCSALALPPNQTDGTGSTQVLLRWGITGTRSPNPAALGSQVTGRALLSKARAAGAPAVQPPPHSNGEIGGETKN